MLKNLNFEGFWHEMGLVGLGNTGGRDLKPHSDKTHVAIGEKEGALGQRGRLDLWLINSSLLLHGS